MFTNIFFLNHHFYSREGSENSQDDDQFRAKREFLKSGLPESFKKQIAKIAANREAYAQSCSLFQTVVHVQQRPISESTLLYTVSNYHRCYKLCMFGFIVAVDRLRYMDSSLA